VRETENLQGEGKWLNKGQRHEGTRWGQKMAGDVLWLTRKQGGLKMRMVSVQAGYSGRLAQDGLAHSINSINTHPGTGQGSRGTSRAANQFSLGFFSYSSNHLSQYIKRNLYE
jgi:hypothetical protein